MATASSKKPSDDNLREMASRPKMTFARMARELQVDRKTARRWCLDIGIDKCGQAEGPADKSSSDSNSLESLMVRVAKLEDLFKAFQEGVKGIACPLPSVELMSVDAFDDVVTFDTVVNQITDKIRTGQAFTAAEQDFIVNFKLLCQAALRSNFDYLNRRIENHHHRALSISEAKAISERR